MQSVDFKKYADIIVNLQMKNEFYWLIKHFDDKTLDHFRSHFDKDSAMAMMESFTGLLDKAILLHKKSVSPLSETGQNLAKEFWELVMEFTGGDISMLSNLMETENLHGPDSKWNEKQGIINAFIEPALEAYFMTIGYNPLGEGVK